MTTTSATPAPSATSLNAKARPWWLTLVMGVTAIIVGAVLLWAPAKTKVETYQLLVALLGIYWLVSGIMHIVSIFVDHAAWGWKLFIGIVSICRRRLHPDVSGGGSGGSAQGLCVCAGFLGHI